MPGTIRGGGIQTVNLRPAQLETKPDAIIYDEVYPFA